MKCRLLLSAVCLAIAANAVAAERPLSRQNLYALSPLAYDALVRTEAILGRAVTDEELPAVMRGHTFLKEHAAVWQRYCELPANRGGFACAKAEETRAVSSKSTRE